ncbi:MAG TPA: alpha/beta hydrolase [Leptospiraceae bacterium]|nr:alpha/beta hydrolase [Leptospiraceae bacterium]HMY65215.1 alpha/beta hydrolase [Leptospiraceae bacterium]HMZ58336.1 alpha/beta hydrolase [Leptospiraceae bacterium]HNF13320.1 alpha/beta hydrolase [Leptospiraceae bacterium]HNF24936.1 alpha/beta hydrolase [Leptospiraceae bacterium]
MMKSGHFKGNSGFEEFIPPRMLRHNMVQSWLASYKRKDWQNFPFVKKSEWVLLEVPDNVRLLASVSVHPNSKGLFILLHGWEGGIDSGYILRTGNYFWNSGYSIARLNLRDHGSTHHLNEEAFNGSMLDETFEAVRKISDMFPDQDCRVIGFSLGGNFACRIAVRNSSERNSIRTLKQCFAVSPPLDPYKATYTMDRHKILRKYFLRAWKDSLEKKKRLFPHLYADEKIDSSRTVMDLTEQLIPKYTEYKNIYSYFSVYTLKNSYFAGLSTPLFILSSKDDPVIPPEEFIALIPGKFLKVHLSEYGGHCGFIKNLKLDSWVWDWVEQSQRDAEL